MADRYERQKRSRKEKYEELKRKGICVWCKKEKATPGFTSCKACRDKLREKAIKARKPSKKMALDETLREIAQYNKEHGTNYSYGYYNTLKFRGLI